MSMSASIYCTYGCDAYGPRTFGPPQLVPNWLVPLEKRSPTNSVPMGFVCPGGREVGDRKSGDQKGPGPNASQPYIRIIIIFYLFYLRYQLQGKQKIFCQNLPALRSKHRNWAAQIGLQWELLLQFYLANNLCMSSIWRCWLCYHGWKYGNIWLFIFNSKRFELSNSHRYHLYIT